MMLTKADKPTTVGPKHFSTEVCSDSEDDEEDETIDEEGKRELSKQNSKRKCTGVKKGIVSNNQIKDGNGEELGSNTNLTTSKSKRRKEVNNGNVISHKQITRPQPYDTTIHDHDNTHKHTQPRQLQPRPRPYTTTSDDEAIRDAAAATADKTLEEDWFGIKPFNAKLQFDAQVSHNQQPPRPHDTTIHRARPHTAKHICTAHYNHTTKCTTCTTCIGSSPSCLGGELLQSFIELAELASPRQCQASGSQEGSERVGTPPRGPPMSKLLSAETAGKCCHLPPLVTRE